MNAYLLIADSMSKSDVFVLYHHKQLTIGRTMKVLMFMRGCAIENVVCKAFNETLYDNTNKVGSQIMHTSVEFT